MDNILIIRSDRLGEFLLSLPAIKLVRHNYPKSKIYLLAQKDNIELVNNLDFVDFFLEYKPHMQGLRGVSELARLFKKEAIDCVMSLNPKKDFHLAAFLARVPIRVGYDRKWGWCLNKKIEDRKFLEEKHEVLYNIELVSLVCKETFVPQVTLPAGDRLMQSSLKNIIDSNKKYVIIHPFTSNQAKQVEDAFWVTLVGKLKDAITCDILMIGSNAEKERSQILAKTLDVANVAGLTDLKSLAHLLSRNCRCFIGLDSGPMHLASILKQPTVGLFRISNPQRWGPYGTRSFIVEGSNVNIFIKKIDEILSFIKATS
ncbi:MAG: glycosyltransferase family 9 protein [Candidatus Omnitrophica bacterium]|nr:glycosyltransferase family 9 protein [Candidatus Omnitrophota bacterium]